MIQNTPGTACCGIALNSNVLGKRSLGTIHKPPSILLEVTEGSIDDACEELAPSDEERVDGDQAAPQVWRRDLSNVHGNGH